MAMATARSGSGAGSVQQVGAGAARTATAVIRSAPNTQTAQSVEALPEPSGNRAWLCSTSWADSRTASAIATASFSLTRSIRFIGPDAAYAYSRDTLCVEYAPLARTLEFEH
jgi:hypothetical protein